MRSIILATSARPILWASLALSVWILLRGHNEPGGGFIGGLIAAIGLIVLALAAGPAAARRTMVLPPIVVAGLGLLAALASALPGLLAGEPLLTHLWQVLDLGIVTLPLGTTLIFDLGVYLVVVGMATGVTLPFLEEA
jgi:multisubunit Na+/H+ antiporter MnhB subunit